MSDKGCSLSLYVHTWLQCVWNITFSSTTSDSFFSNRCSVAIQFQISLSPCELPHVLELLDMMELQSRSNVDEMYPLRVPASAVSILSLLYRITECTEPHKKGKVGHSWGSNAVPFLFWTLSCKLLRTYHLSCVHTLASISCKLFRTNRSTECTEPHKRERLDTAEVAMRCHFCSELYLVNF